LKSQILKFEIPWLSVTQNPPDTHTHLIKFHKNPHPMPTKPITFDLVREIALTLPGVEVSTSYGAPSLKVRRKLLACRAINKSAEPDTLVVHVDLAQRAHLLASEPQIYYLTDHYAPHPLILVRLSKIKQPALKKLLRTACELLTPKPKTSRPKSPS